MLMMTIGSNSRCAGISEIIQGIFAKIASTNALGIFDSANKHEQIYSRVILI